MTGGRPRRVANCHGDKENLQDFLFGVSMSIANQPTGALGRRQSLFVQKACDAAEACGQP